MPDDPVEPDEGLETDPPFRPAHWSAPDVTQSSEDSAETDAAWSEVFVPRPPPGLKRTERRRWRAAQRDKQSSLLRERRRRPASTADTAGLGVLVVVVAVAGFAFWLGGRDSTTGSEAQAPPSAASNSARSTTLSPPGAASTTERAETPSNEVPSPGGAVSQLPPRPARSAVPIDPDAIALQPRPTGDVDPGELADPVAAVNAWVSRICPYSYVDPYGTAQASVRPLMTAAGWVDLDPATDALALSGWEPVIADRETAQCAAPNISLASEADAAVGSVVYAVISVLRVVMVDEDATRLYVESLTETRGVVRQADRTWQVDVAVAAGTG